MLSEKRISEAETNVAQFLEDGLLSKVDVLRKEVLATYKKNYEESLDVAKKIYDQKLSSLWVVVCSYYAMFYIANAVLYKIGYKVGGNIVHKVTSDALIVYVRKRLKKSYLEEYEEAKEEVMELIGKKADDVISHYDKELSKRSIFQYETTEEIKRTKAETSLKRAQQFVFEMVKLL